MEELRDKVKMFIQEADEVFEVLQSSEGTKSKEILDEQKTEQDIESEPKSKKKVVRGVSKRSEK